MGEETKKPNDAELAAQKLKEAITQRGESTLAEILEQARGLRNGLSVHIGAQMKPDPAGDAAHPSDAADDAASFRHNGAEHCGVETVEYAPKLVMRQADDVSDHTPRERRREVRTRIAQRHGAVLSGKSRSEQLNIIRRFSDEAVEELPERFYDKLSGGISLSDAVKYHPKSQNERPLLILGEYRNDPRIGRSIMLYGGSIIKNCAYMNEQQLKNELSRIIRHEFTHHIESLCGERGLEIEDEVNLAQYQWELSESKKAKKTKSEKEDCR